MESLDAPYGNGKEILRKSYGIHGKAQGNHRESIRHQQSYGYQAHGAAPYQTQRMRGNFRIATGYSQRRACTTTMFAWEYDREVDPAITIPLGQLLEWVNIWRMMSAMKRRQAASTWLKLYRELHGNPNRWNATRGPAAATINTLLDMKIQY